MNGRGRFSLVFCVAAALGVAAGPAAAFEEGPAAWTAISPAELDAQRAMGAEADFDGTVTNSTVQIGDDVSMTNDISGNAFQGAAGMFNVIQNNGNNNVINAGLSVSIGPVGP